MKVFDFVLVLFLFLLFVLVIFLVIVVIVLVIVLVFVVQIFFDLVQNFLELHFLVFSCVFVVDPQKLRFKEMFPRGNI